MKIESESFIAHPRDRVFSAYRDRLPEIAAYIPDIREIVVESREERDGVVHLHNVWASDREVPSVASRILKPEHLRWDDLATWRPDAFVCDWEIRTRAFTDAVECRGQNTFLDEGEGTRVVLSGHFNIELDQVPGVPSFLVRKLAPKLESFIVSLITPNLERVNASLQQFLDEQGAP